MDIPENSATLQKIQNQNILSLNKTHKFCTENWKDHAERLTQNLLIIKLMELNFPTFLFKTDSTTGQHLLDAKIFFFLLSIYNVLLKKKNPKHWIAVRDKSTWEPKLQRITGLSNNQFNIA